MAKWFPASSPLRWTERPFKLRPAVTRVFPSGARIVGGMTATSNWCFKASQRPQSISTATFKRSSKCSTPARSDDRRCFTWRMSSIAIGTRNWLWSSRARFNACSFPSSFSLGQCSANTVGLTGRVAQPDAPVRRWHPMVRKLDEMAAALQPQRGCSLQPGYGAHGGRVRALGQTTRRCPACG